MKIIFFLDSKVKQLEPITLTRTPNHIRCGGYNLEELVGEIFGSKTVIQYQKGEREWVWRFSQNTLWLNSRIIPSVRAILRLKRSIRKGQEKGNLPLFQYPWEVILENQRILSSDLDYKKKNFYQYQNIYLGEGVTLSQEVVYNVEEGPIILDRGVKIGAFVVLEGPLYIGPDTQVKDFTTLSASTIGKVCKLRGEIEESIIEDYTNKQHYGFLGHSYVGSWVNFGAGTTISDLKNTYGEIKIDFLGKRRRAGTQFLGGVIGDYVKTAINTTITSGKLIGPNSFLYGFVTENVPAFTNFYGQKRVEFYLAEAYKVQARMFARRGIQVTEQDRAVLRKAFHSTKKERQNYAIQKGYFVV